MKICFVVENISNCGGTERVMLSIANELVKRGHDIQVLSHHGNGHSFFSKDERVKVCTLFSSSWEITYLAFRTKYIVMKCAMYFRWTRPDVVIDTDLLISNLTIPALSGTRIKHIAWDNMSYVYFMKATPERLALDKMVTSGSHLLVLTKQDQKNYELKESFPANRIHQIFNPITIDTIPYQNRKNKKVLSVGRFANEKGFDLLLKAWLIVEQTVDDWSLEIWGDTGRDTGDVHETFDNLPLKRASLNGTTSDIASKFQESSIYVLSSRYEPFGLVLLEAAASSLPLIAFDCPNGPREIIQDGENGILVKPENVDALASTILRLIRDKELRERLCRNAYERSRDFRMENIIPQWIDLLEDVVKG